MKKLLIASAMVLAISGSAMAQTDAGSGTARPDATSPQSTGSIPNARMEVIRNYWRSERPAAVTIRSGVTLSRGMAVPEDVEIRAFPSTVDAGSYRYVVVGNQFYLVNPSDRKVVEVID